MKNKRLLILLVVIFAIMIISIGGYFLFKEKPVVVVETREEKYVAYIRINPSIKLDYAYNCTKYSDDTEKCDEPNVYEYQLVNDDAKEIFKDVNLLEGNTELSSVIDLICTKVEEKGIKIDNIEIKSDWNNIENYLAKKQEETINKVNNQTENNDSNNEIKDNNEENNMSENTSKEVTKHTYTFNNESKETITNNIEEDIQKEEQEKKEKEEKARKEAEEKAKKEAEEKAKKEAEEKARLAKTIMLNKGVTYCHSMTTYECNNCFSSTLINTLKKAKGHYVKASSASSITILRITKLSNPYNSTTFYGTSVLNKITQAGGQEVGGAGGCDEPVTKTICNQYHLTCQ